MAGEDVAKDGDEEPGVGVCVALGEYGAGVYFDGEEEKGALGFDAGCV